MEGEIRTRGRFRVQRDEERAAIIQPLQAVHPIGQADVAIVLLDDVPAGPGIAARGHQGGVTVQVDRVRTIVDRTQQEGLVLEAFLDKAKRLIRMGRENDVVENVRAIVFRDHGDLVAKREDADGRRSGADAVTQFGGGRVHIGLAAAGDRAPLRALLVHQAVVLEELEEAAGRIVQHADFRRGPDGCAHGQDIVAAEGLVEAVKIEPVTQRRVLDPARCKFGAREVIEFQDGAPETMEVEAEQVAFLGEDATGGRGPFPTVAVRHGKAHVGFLRFDIEGIEQADQVGIVETIVDDEAEIDGGLVAVIIEDVRAGVAAEAVLCLKQGDVGCVLQRVGRADAGNAGPDNCNTFHAASRLSLSVA